MDISLRVEWLEEFSLILNQSFGFVLNPCDRMLFSDCRTLWICFIKHWLLFLSSESFVGSSISLKGSIDCSLNPDLYCQNYAFGFLHMLKQCNGSVVVDLLGFSWFSESSSVFIRFLKQKHKSKKLRKGYFSHLLKLELLKLSNWGACQFTW